MAATKIFNLWAKRGPEWERNTKTPAEGVLQTTVRVRQAIKKTRAKLFGAGYELYILAFFIGLYHD